MSVGAVKAFFNDLHAAAHQHYQTIHLVLDYIFCILDPSTICASITDAKTSLSHSQKVTDGVSSLSDYII
jgi:hypothetical protein